LDPSLDHNELKDFVNQLREKCYAFQAVSSNAREFISIFLTDVVNHVRKNHDQTTRLAVQVDLMDMEMTEMEKDYHTKSGSDLWCS